MNANVSGDNYTDKMRKASPTIILPDLWKYGQCNGSVRAQVIVDGGTLTSIKGKYFDCAAISIRPIQIVGELICAAMNG